MRNLGHLRCIDDWIIHWRRHMYHQLWQLIDLWVSVNAIKARVITMSVLWRAVWLLMNQGQLRRIDDWNIQWRRHMYHRWWQFVDIWVKVVAIKPLVITRSCLLPALIVPCFTVVVTINSLWTWHDECNMSLWWCCVTVILFVDVHRRVGANFFA